MNIINKNNLWILLAYTLLLLVFAYNFLTYFNHDVIGGMRVLSNSDSMYMPTLYDNLINHSGLYKNWYLAPAPYFFPDMTLYFIANFFGGNFYYANFIFFNLQLLLLFWFLKKINDIFFKQEIALLFSVSSVAFLYGISFSFSGYLIRSSHHFGSFLVGLAFIYLLLKIIESEKLKAGYGLSLVVLISLIVMSDKIFLLQFVAPSIAALFVLAVVKRLTWVALLRIIILFAIGIAVGLFLYQLVMKHITAYPVNYGWENIKKNMTPFLSIFSRTFQSNYYYTIIFILFYIICLFLITTYLWRLLSKRTFFAIYSLDRLFVVIFVLFSLCGISFVVVSSSLGMMHRFVIPIFILPICFIPMIIAFVIKTKRHKLNFAKLSCISMFIMLFSYTVLQASEFEFKSDYYPKYIQCFDNFVIETESKRGISEYWQSKKVTMLSKQGATVAQTNDVFDPYLWISTTEWYADRYDFVVVATRDENEINGFRSRMVNIIGQEPSQTYSCSPLVIFYFDQGFSLKTHDPFL